MTYKVGFGDIYRDVIAKRLSVDASRKTTYGPNVLSISYIDDNDQLINASVVELKDGMLSAAKFGSSNSVLSLYFNPDVTTTPLTVDLASLKDAYFPGYGLALCSDNKTFYISCDIKGLSSRVKNLETNVTTLCGDINVLCGNFNNYIPWSASTSASGDINNSSTNKVTNGRAVHDYVQPVINTVNNLCTAVNNLTTQVYVNHSTTLCGTVNGLIGQVGTHTT